MRGSERGSGWYLIGVMASFLVLAFALWKEFR